MTLYKNIFLKVTVNYMFKENKMKIVGAKVTEKLPG